MPECLNFSRLTYHSTSPLMGNWLCSWGGGSSPWGSRAVDLGWVGPQLPCPSQGERNKKPACTYPFFPWLGHQTAGTDTPSGAQAATSRLSGHIACLRTMCSSQLASSAAASCVCLPTSSGVQAAHPLCLSLGVAVILGPCPGLLLMAPDPLRASLFAVQCSPRLLTVLNINA